MKLGRQIREAREKVGMTQGTLAQMLKTRQAVVSSIELDKCMPSVPRLVQIAIALDVSIDEMVGI